MVRKVACDCHGDEGGDEVVMVVRGVGDDGDGGVTAAVEGWQRLSGAATVVAAGGGKWRVAASGGGDRVDPMVGNIFGL
ncbi:hypothetical protein Tco_1121238 [Tanacetum coccineum]|uniref:Uncharacterized protein n=1 Tax=Tanacetum coccineum TaxID=301880 RepID=A0ABQ5IX67_9ASTR